MVTTDAPRWANKLSYHSIWNTRTQHMRALIPKDATSVADVGAGMCHLKGLLTADQIYYPIDLVSRGELSTVVDFNVIPYPELPTADVYFMSGVLEYINDLEYFFTVVSNVTKYIICSLADVSDWAGGADWNSSNTFNKLIVTVEKLGYTIVTESRWDSQRLYVFEMEDKNETPIRS